MPEFVMRHPKLPGQPIIVHAENEEALSGGTSPQEDAGWRLAKTKPEDLPVQPTSEPAEPVSPSKKEK